MYIPASSIHEENKNDHGSVQQYTLQHAGVNIYVLAIFWLLSHMYNVHVPA